MYTSEIPINLITNVSEEVYAIETETFEIYFNDYEHFIKTYEEMMFGSEIPKMQIFRTANMLFDKEKGLFVKHRMMGESRANNILEVYGIKVIGKQSFEKVKQIHKKVEFLAGMVEW